MQTDQLLKITESYEMGFRYHIIKTGKIPHRVAIHSLDEKKWENFFRYVSKQYNWAEENYILNEEHRPDGTVKKISLIHLNNNVTLFKGFISAFLYHDPEIKEETITNLKDRFSAIELEKNTSKNIGIIVNMGQSLGVETFEYSLPENTLIEYLPSKTKEFHQSVIEQLEAKNGSGLYLMYGEPGTGKTSFIKGVLSQTQKQALFISPFFTESLTSPKLISLLMEHPNSILVIEDAETVLMERKADNSSAVSNLLNLTDGFLADFLNLKIICTFNTELKNIDDALLREGRLNGMHKFEKVQPERAQKVAEVLNRDIDPDGPMTLAEICASETHLTEYNAQKIGFNNSY